MKDTYVVSSTIGCASGFWFLTSVIAVIALPLLLSFSYRFPCPFVKCKHLQTVVAIFCIVGLYDDFLVRSPALRFYRAMLAQSAVRPMRLLSSIRLCDSTAFLSIHPPIFICSRNFKLHITCRSVFCSAMKRRQKTTKDNKRRQTTAKDDKKTAKFAVFWRLLPSFARQ